jgi:hypothetical protein
MASPFQKYQSGIQASTENLVPAFGRMAEQTTANLTNLGKNLGDALTKYQDAQEERDELAQVAQSELSKYVVPDLSNSDDKDRFKASEDAPQHSADLINIALKEGDGDVARGMAAVPMSKLKGWYNADARYQKAVQIKAENDFKDRELKLRKDANAVAIAAQELAKKEYELRKSEADRKAQEAKEEKAKLDLFRRSTDLSGVPTTTQVRETQATTIEEIGDIFDKNGELIASNVMLQDGMKALGLKPEDVITEAQAIAIRTEGTEGFKFNAVGKYLTQNDKYNHKATFSEAIQNGYAESFIRNAFKQANAWSLEKTGKELTGVEALFPQGLDGTINNTAKAYELAVKYSQNPAFVDYIKAQGVNMIPDGAAFNKAYYTVTGKESYSPTVIHTVGLNEAARLKIRYDEIAAASGGSDKLPLSLYQIMAMQPDRFLPSAEITLPDGSTQRVYKAGKDWVPATSLVGLGERGTPDTEAGLNIASADRWLRNFNKPQQFGNITVQFVGGINNFAGKWSEDYPILKQGFTDVEQTGKIANEMRQYVNKGLLSKVMDVEARNRFDSLVMRATTYRRYFIAGGQETEPDAQRLFDIVGAMNTSRMVFKDAHLKAIDAFESILRDKVVGQARQNGFRVAVNKAGEKIDLKKIIADVEAENKKQGLNTPAPASSK